MKQNYNSGVSTLTRITVMGLTVLLLWGEVGRVEGKLVKARYNTGLISGEMNCFLNVSYVNIERI